MDSQKREAERRAYGFDSWVTLLNQKVRSGLSIERVELAACLGHPVAQYYLGKVPFPKFVLLEQNLLRFHSNSYLGKPFGKPWGDFNVNLSAAGAWVGKEKILGRKWLIDFFFKNIGVSWCNDPVSIEYGLAMAEDFENGRIDVEELREARRTLMVELDDEIAEGADQQFEALRDVVIGLMRHTSTGVDFCLIFDNLIEAKESVAPKLQVALANALLDFDGR